MGLSLNFIFIQDLFGSEIKYLHKAFQHHNKKCPFFSFRSNCIELDFKEISYLVIS